VETGVKSVPHLQKNSVDQCCTYQCQYAAAALLSISLCGDCCKPLNLHRTTHSHPQCNYTTQLYNYTTPRWRLKTSEKTSTHSAPVTRQRMHTAWYLRRYHSNRWCVLIPGVERLAVGWSDDMLQGCGWSCGPATDSSNFLQQTLHVSTKHTRSHTTQYVKRTRHHLTQVQSTQVFSTAQLAATNHQQLVLPICSQLIDCMAHQKYVLSALVS